MDKNEKLNKFVNIFSVFIVLIFGVVIKEIVKSAFKKQTPQPKILKMNTNIKINAFDVIYNQMVYDLEKNNSLKENYKMIAKTQIESVQKEMAKDNIILSQEGVLLLQKNLEKAILDFDYGAYWKSKKNVFLEKIGMTEDEFLNKISSLKNEEEKEMLKRKIKMAAFAMGVELWQGEYFQNVFDQSIQEIIQKKYIIQQ